MLFTGLLRIRSLNALEPRLGEASFRRLISSVTGSPLGAPASVDTISRALRVIDLEALRNLGTGLIAQAERNKVFRDEWLRCVALDGWEPICSNTRHCMSCLVRRIKVKQKDGTVAEVDQYYHRYVVAMLVHKRFDLALDIEPCLPHDFRPKRRNDKGEDEGELTAALRLLSRVKSAFPWLDVVIGDALYANGPFLTVARDLKMGVIVTARKESDEPLKEALHLWRDQPPQKVVEDSEAKERVELWDCHDLETLESYRAPVRVIRGRVTPIHDPDATGRTWCMLATGAPTRLAPERVLSLSRRRWHIENTGFHQWTTHWYFDHAFVRHHHGLLATYWLFFAAFNLLTLFLYLQLRCYGRDRGNNRTRTISRLIDEMRDDLARFDTS